LDETQRVDKQAAPYLASIDDYELDFDASEKDPTPRDATPKKLELGSRNGNL